MVAAVTVAGRGHVGRNVTVNTTSASTAITAPAGTFDGARDVGRTITGAGIPAGATLAAVASATAATLSANATATASSVPVALGPANPNNYGFIGRSPVTDAESTAYTVAGVNAGQVPADRITSPTQARVQRVLS